MRARAYVCVCVGGGGGYVWLDKKNQKNLQCIVHVLWRREVIRILLKSFSETELSRLNTLASYNILPRRSLNISPTCLCTLYLHACQVRITLGDASLCCFICVTYFERLLSPLCVSFIKCYGQNRLFWELATYIHTSH